MNWKCAQQETQKDQGKNKNLIFDENKVLKVFKVLLSLHSIVKYILTKYIKYYLHITHHRHYTRPLLHHRLLAIFCLVCCRCFPRYDVADVVCRAFALLSALFPLYRIFFVVAQIFIFFLFLFVVIAVIIMSTTELLDAIYVLYVYIYFYALFSLSFILAARAAIRRLLCFHV